LSYLLGNTKEYVGSYNSLIKNLKMSLKSKTKRSSLVFLKIISKTL